MGPQKAAAADIQRVQGDFLAGKEGAVFLELWKHLRRKFSELNSGGVTMGVTMVI